MSPEKRHRRDALLKKVLWAAAILAGYYIFVRLTGLSIPCVFREVTGLKCPGCGVTHMAMHAAHFEFGRAFKSNPLLFFMFPFFGAVLAVKLIFMSDALESNSRVYRIGERICLGLVMVFWVVRNIVGI